MGRALREHLHGCALTYVLCCVRGDSLPPAAVALPAVFCDCRAAATAPAHRCAGHRPVRAVCQAQGKAACMRCTTNAQHLCLMCSVTNLHLTLALHTVLLLPSHTPHVILKRRRCCSLYAARGHPTLVPAAARCCCGCRWGLACCCLAQWVVCSKMGQSEAAWARQPSSSSTWPLQRLQQWAPTTSGRCVS